MLIRINCKTSWLLLLMLLWHTTVVPLCVADDALEDLGIIEAQAESVVSASRSPRPASRIAENITVITADDIERLNAHTLAEVLQTVPGIQLDYLRTPGTFSFFNVQGAYNTTVLVLVDGIRQNDFDQNMAIPGLIPVQQIERIEVIKGAASAAWGPALGGVINIITKSPDAERKFSGMVSGSTGSQFTADSRAEVSGTLDRFGYYLTAANLRSDGLTPNTGTNQNNLFTKLSYQLPHNGSLTFGLSYLTASPGLDEGDTVSWGFVHDNNQYRRTNAYLKLNQPLTDRLTLELDSFLTNRDDHTKWGAPDGMGGFAFYSDGVARDTSQGINARLRWGDYQKSLLLGLDYAHAWAINRDALSSAPPLYERSWDRWGIYANGAYTVGQLTILPGARYDITGTSGDVTSLTLGATYQLAEHTLLRAYAAQGYTLPTPKADNRLQKIKTVQAGIESEALPFLWLKGTFFFNALRDSQSVGTATATNQYRQGFELEARTTPLYGLSLTSGYTYLDAWDSDTGQRLHTNSNQAVPPHTVKLALNYDQQDLGLRGTLTGNYVWWNRDESSAARDTGMIWDLHLNWRLKSFYKLTPELFFSAHNLFNGVQTTDTELYTNAKRWFEGGMRVKF
jgi:vitamin B12 transporter